MTRALVVACAGVALASAAITLPDTWRWLSEQRRELAQLTAVDRQQAPGFNNRLPVGGFDFFRAHVRRGDRVFVLARTGTSLRGVDFPTAARTFARYYLLPAIVVDDLADATVVVSIGANPRTLGRTFASVVSDDNGTFVVARIKDPE